MSSTNKVDASADEEYYDHQIITVDPNQEQVRIDKFLLSRLEQVSRNRIQLAIKAGAIVVNDKQIKSNYKVRPKDIIKVVLPKNANNPDHIIPEDIPLDIVYEDDHLLVINKAAGLVVHPGTGNHSGTLVNALVHHFKSKDLPVMQGNSNDRPGLVHRLDKDTTGLMVIAKTDSAMTHLAKQFFDHSIVRSYQAIVWSGFEQESGRIEGHIGRHPTERIKMHVFTEGEEGKHAITHYKVIHDYYYVSLVECRLETGRTHQIRVHMNHIGHPVFNDDRYGGDRIRKGTVYSKYRRFVENCFELCPRQALHAQSLGFIHPETGEQMQFESDLPEDMVAAIDRWRAYFDTKGGKTD